MNRLSSYCSNVIEFGWLFVLASIPLFFNLNTNLVFEPDKVLLLRSIVLVMTLAWLVKASVGGTNDVPVELSAISRQPSGDGAGRRGLLGVLRAFPVEAALIAFAAAQIIAAILSIEPGLSWKGTYFRSQGLQTLLAWVTLALLMAAEIKTTRQLDRIVAVMLLTSVPVAWYGIVQMTGWDPAGFGIPYGRASSSIGNPIWFGAYLVTVIPLAVWRLSRAVYAWRMHERPPLTERGKEQRWSWALTAVGAAVPVVWAWLYMNYLAWSGGQPGAWWSFGAVLSLGAILAIFVAPIGSRIPPLLRAAGFGAMLGLQLAALLMAASRGPAVGLVAAALAFAIIAGRHWHRPRLWQAGVAATVLIALFVVAVNFPGSPLGGLRSIPVVGRILAFQTEGQLPANGRFLIWGAGLDLVLSPREGYGNGPDVPLALRPLVGYGPDTFGDIFQRAEPPALANATSRTTVFDRAHSQWVDVLVQSGLLGLIAYAAFLVAAVRVGLAALRGTRDTDRTFFLLAVLSGLIGHAVEAQSGLQNMPTEVNFAAYLALLAAAGHVRSLGARSPVPEPDPRAGTPVEPEPARRVEEPVRVPAVPAGVGAVTRGRRSRVAVPQVPPARVRTRSGPAGGGAPRGDGDERVLGIWPADKLVWAGVYVALLLMALAFVGILNSVRTFTIPASVLVLSAIPVLLLGAGMLGAGEPGLVRVGATLPARTMAWWPALLLYVMALPFLTLWNIVPPAADALYKLAVGEENKLLGLPENDVIGRGRLQLQALSAHRDTVEALPMEDWYYQHFANALYQMGLLRNPVSLDASFTISWQDVMATPINTLAVAGRSELFLAARAVYEQALLERPASAEYAANLARNYKNSVFLNRDDFAAPAAIEWYKNAIERAPYHVVYRVELSEMYGALQSYEEAIEAADGALRQDPNYWRAHLDRSIALQRLGRLNEALVSAEAAFYTMDKGYEIPTAIEIEAVVKQLVDVKEAIVRELNPG